MLAVTHLFAAGCAVDVSSAKGPPAGDRAGGRTEMRGSARQAPEMGSGRCRPDPRYVMFTLPFMLGWILQW